MTTNIPRVAYALLARGYIAKRTVPDQLPDDVCFLYAPLITSDDLGIQFGYPGPDGFMPAKWIADSQFIIVEGFSEATPAQQGLLVNLADNIGKHRVVFVIEPDSKRPNDATIAAGNRAEDAARVSGMPVAATNRFNH